MSLNDKQRSWLEQMSGIKSRAAAAEKKMEARQGAQAVIEDRIGEKRDELRSFLEGIEIVDPGDGGAFDTVKAALGLATKMKVLEPGGDPMKELDIWHDSPMKDHIPEKTRIAIQQKIGELMQLSDELANMTVDGTPDGEKVYDNPRQIATDLWEPLVREGVIPENFVPGQYSEVETTFGAAAELYDERLQEYSKSVSSSKEIAKKFNSAAEFAKLGFEVGASILQMEAGIHGAQQGIETMEAFKQTDEYKDLNEKAELLELVGASIAAVGTGVEAAVVDKDVVKSLDSFMVAVSKALGQTVSKDFAKDVSLIATAVIHAYPVAKRLKTWRDTGEWKWDEFMDDLGDAVSKGLAAGDAGSDSEFYAKVGEAVEGGFKLIGAGIAVKDHSGFDKIAENIGEAVGKITSSVVGILKEEEIERIKASDEYKEADEKQQKKLIKEGTEIFEEVEGTTDPGIEGVTQVVTAKGKLAEIMEAGGKKFDEEKAKEIQAAANQAMTDQLKEYMEAPDDQFEAMLVTGFSEDAYAATPDPSDESEEAARKRAEQEERKLKSIEQLIALQKKHEQTYKLSKTIVGLGTKGLGALKDAVPGLGIPAVATQMMFSMYEAAKHGQQFLIWRANVKDASAAHTVQLEAILNRHGLEKKQTIEAGIKAALDAAKLVGEILKLAGHAAPAGYALSAAATGAAALLEISSKVATEVQMRSAWNTYKKAIATPQDRKLARQALRENPTLAKYAMAWGAVVDGNAIAQECMRRCGINDTTLADPGTNVSKVVTYLENLYKDDPVLLKSVSVDKGWYPGSVELTASSWARFIFAAQDEDAKGAKKADPLLARVDGSGVAGSLSTFVEAVAAIAGIDTEELDSQREKLETAKAACDRLIVAFVRFGPTSVDGGRHQQFFEYKETLQARAELQLRKVEERLTEVKSELEV